MCLRVFGWNKGFVEPSNGKLENSKQTTDRGNRVATGVLNFAHTNNGI